MLARCSLVVFGFLALQAERECNPRETFFQQSGLRTIMGMLSVLSVPVAPSCIDHGSCQEQLLNRVGRAAVAILDNIVDVVAHRHEQVEEELRVALLHLHLHRAAALEGLAAADDEGEVVGAEARVAGRRVRIREACTAQDSRHVDTSLQTLLPKSEALQIWQTETKRSAVDGCIPEDVVTRAVMVGGRRLIEADELLRVVRMYRTGGHCRVLQVLERPSVALLVVQEARVVVALVQVLEDSAEDLRLVVWEADAALAWGREELITAGGGEPRRARQHILVSSEQTLVLADDYRDDSAVQLG